MCQRRKRQRAAGVGQRAAVIDMGSTEGHVGQMKCEQKLAHDCPSGDQYPGPQGAASLDQNEEQSHSAE